MGWARGVSSEKMVDRWGKRRESDIDNRRFRISRFAKTKGRSAIAQAPASSKPRANFGHRGREGRMSFLRSWSRGDRQHSFHYQAALPFSRSFLYTNATENRDNLFNNMN